MLTAEQAAAQHRAILSSAPVAVANANEISKYTMAREFARLVSSSARLTGDATMSSTGGDRVSWKRLTWSVRRSGQVHRVEHYPTARAARILHHTGAVFPLDIFAAQNAFSYSRSPGRLSGVRHARRTVRNIDSHSNRQSDRCQCRAGRSSILGALDELGIPRRSRIDRSSRPRSVPLCRDRAGSMGSDRPQS